MSRPRQLRRRSAARKRISLSRIVVAAFAVPITLIVLFAAAYIHGKQSAVTYIAPAIDIASLQHVALPIGQSEEIIQYTGFKVSFNAEHHIPNYSTWELTAAETEGRNPRKSDFYQERSVDGCPTLDDYRKSGFDRGHMAPAADMKWSEQAMDDSHSLANICPQDHSINSGRWSTLEKLCRQWAVRDSTILIICGPVLSDAMPQTIGKNKVSVPRRFFKVVLAPYAEPIRAIGFIMPNNETDESLDAMVYSIDEVETITGYDFFAALPDSIECMVEQSANYRLWNKQKQRRK